LTLLGGVGQAVTGFDGYVDAPDAWPALPTDVLSGV
jgi:hypothetical protein